MLRELVSERPDWPVVAFGDVVNNMTRTVNDPVAAGIGRYVGLEHLDGRDLRVRRWGDVADGTTFTRAFEPGEVLFGKRRAYQRKAATATFKGICSGDLLVFAPASERLLPEMLLLVVSSDSFVEHALATSAGSLSPRTRWKDLANFRFLLPPRDVQQRAVSVSGAALDEADAFTSASRAASVAARAAFAEALTSRSDWPTVHLADVLLQSPESGCSAPESPRETGHYVLGLQAVSRDGYVPGQFKAVEPTPEMLKARVQEGDVLVTRSNTLDRVGFAAMYGEATDNVSFPDTMMRLRPNVDLVLDEFVVAALMSPLGRRHLMRVAAGTSASMKKINRKTLGAFEFPLPPLAEQHRILEAHAERMDLAKRLADVAVCANHVVAALRREVFGS